VHCVAQVLKHSSYIKLGPSRSYLDNDGMNMIQLSAIGTHRLNSNDNVMSMELLDQNYFLKYIEGQEGRRIRLLVE
jgi:hypothetical protein